MDLQILFIGFLVALGFLLSFATGVWLANKDKNSDTENFDVASLQPEAAIEAQNLIENIAAAVVLRDQQGKIIYCSPYIEVLTGYARKEIYENPDDFFLTICHERDKERLFRSLKISELGGEPFQFTFQFFHRSGIEMWAESRTVPLFDEQGAITGTISVTLDVSAMMTHQRLVEQKNHELKEFTSMVSHDLKAPIYTINGLINVLKEDFSDEFPKAAEEIFSTIERSGLRLESLIQSILDYARIGAKELLFEPVSLNEVFEDVLAENHHAIDQAKASIKLEDLPVIFGDRSSLIQIFSNLIGNAVKYRNKERPIEIQVSTMPHTAPKHVMIKIADNGLGIPANRLDDIWRPFVRLHETEAQGTGIGLATVKKLVEKMNGTITVTSKEHEGSVFTVILRSV